MKKVIFISGIDTDSGKTYATGMLAAWLHSKGVKVITQKLAQTGCQELSDDILLHRKLMNIPLQEVDHQGLTAPYIFPFAASPHLSAELAGVELDINKIDTATNELLKIYDIVLLEGAGGLLAPINRSITTADFIAQRNYPLLLVTSAKIGSINHTLLSLEAIRARNIDLQGLIYNRFPVQNSLIANDSLALFHEYLTKYNFKDIIADLPICSENFTYQSIDDSIFAHLYDSILNSEATHEC